jgi:nucleoside-diphosphate-sugar epimerase
MAVNNSTELLADRDDLLLVTGASGFIGRRVVERLLAMGFRNLRCLVRRTGAGRLAALQAAVEGASVEIMNGNLLSREDCARAARGVAVIYHAAAGRGEKSVPDAFLNSVVTTRNLMEEALAGKTLKRFVNVSSFAVYSNAEKKGKLLDENCPIEQHPVERGDAYCFAKVKQDEIVAEYGSRFGLPYVIVRPGYVYGPGNEGMTPRVGIGTFGIFLHLGGLNTIPITYVENCAEAIVLAGLVPGVDGQVFNVVDDDLPSSRSLLRQYKKNVQPFRSIYLPHAVSYSLCWAWERYVKWSDGQLPLSFNRRDWHATWKSTKYSNARIKERLGWTPRVPTSEGLSRHFEACRRKVSNG